MRAGLVALAVLIAIAGCAGDSPAVPQGVQPDEDRVPVEPSASTQGESADAPVAETPVEQENTGPKSLHFEQTFSLTITHAYVPAPPTGVPYSPNHDRVNQDPNCVGFGKDQVWLILNGTAEATWSSPGPFAGQMTVDLRDVGPLATNNGSASPSRLEFGRFQTVPNALLGLWVIVQPTDPGVVVQQPLSLTISFNYLGSPDVKAVVEPCVYRTAFEEEAAMEVRA